MDFLVKDQDQGKVVLYRMEDLSHQVVSQIQLQNQHIGLIMSQISEIGGELNKLIGGINKLDGKQMTIVESFSEIKSELAAINESLLRQNQQYTSLIKVFNDLADEIREVKSEISARKNGPFRVPSTGEIVSVENVVEVIAAIKDQLGQLQQQAAEINDAVAERAVNRIAVDALESKINELGLEMHEFNTRTGDRLRSTDVQIADIKTQLTQPLTQTLKKRVRINMEHNDQTPSGSS